MNFLLIGYNKFENIFHFQKQKKSEDLPQMTKSSLLVEITIF